MTTRASRGMETVTSLRLCSRAPETTMESWRGIHNPVYVAPGRGAGARPRLADDAEVRPARARHVARGVACPDDEPVAAGAQAAPLEAAREARRARPGRAGLGEAALQRDPAPAAGARAVATLVRRDPAAADAAEGPVLLDREDHPRGLAQRVGDRRAGADGDAAATRAAARAATIAAAGRPSVAGLAVVVVAVTVAEHVAEPEAVLAAVAAVGGAAAEEVGGGGGSGRRPSGQRHHGGEGDPRRSHAGTASEEPISAAKA